VTLDEAARRWAETWEHGWAAHDVEAIAALYADGAVFLTAPFRETRLSPAGVREYTEWAFADEAGAEVRFGKPVVAGDGRAVVEWWTVSRSTAGEDSTLAGVSLLRFGADGLVVEQYDYWHVEPGRRAPHEHFGRWPQG
jgi:ketosteroid isomerase-like protein